MQVPVQLELAHSSPCGFLAATIAIMAADGPAAIGGSGLKLP